MFVLEGSKDSGEKENMEVNYYFKLSQKFLNPYFKNQSWIIKMKFLDNELNLSMDKMFLSQVL